MKIKLLNFFVIIGQFILNLIYSVMKLKKTKNKVLLLSRQSNKKSLDFSLLEESLKKHKNIKIVCMYKMIGKSFISKIGYCFYMLRIMNNLANSKVCIIDGYSIPISLLKHKKDLVIIQMWHASGATKKFGYQVVDKKEGASLEITKIMKMHKNYDYVLAPSKKTGEIYSEAFNIPEDKIVYIGLPRLDYLKDRSKDNKLKEEFLKAYPKYLNKEIILYVPTFRKGKEISSYDLISKINNEKYGLIIRKHPLDIEKEDNDFIVDKRFETMDLLKIADIIITDYSAIAYESCILNKPLYFYVYDIMEYIENRGLNIDIAKEMREATFKKAETLVKSIESNMYNYSQLYDFRDKYVEVYKKNNTEELTKFIIKNMNNSSK